MQYFSLSTNVNELRIGNNSSKNIGKEIGKFVVSTMEIPWSIIKNELGKSPEKLINVTSVELSWIENQIEDLPDFDTIVGISLANVHSSAITVHCYINDGSNDISLVKDVTIPVGSSLQVLDGGAKFVVQSGDALKVTSSAASSLDVWVSVVDAISS